MPLKPNLPDIKSNKMIAFDDDNNVTISPKVQTSQEVISKTTTTSSITNSGISKSTTRESSIAPNNNAVLTSTTTDIVNSSNISFLTSTEDDKDLNKYISNLNIRSLSGIEAVPYQFLPSVDRRIGSGISEMMLGRKYTEKIVTQMPLLFLVPCNPLFMDDNKFSNNDRNIISQALAGVVDNIDGLLEGSGRFYSSTEAYTQYYNYLNVMLASISSYLGIGDEKITLPGAKNATAIKNVNWADEINKEMSEVWKAKKNLVFYMDSIDTVQESFGNTTQESMLNSLINGFSDKAKELDYLFGSGNTNLASSLLNGSEGATSAIAAALGSATEKLGGSIIGSIGNSVDSILDGGKIVFPEMWQDSSYDKSFNISFKFRSPDNDSLSIFMNVLKPYCKLLCFAMPHMVKDNVNAYRTPFICKAYSQGRFNIDLGIMHSISATKGATCCWNDDGLPTQIDVDIEIKDLYNQLTMTGFSDDSTPTGIIGGTWNDLKNTPAQTYNIVSNTAYMDFLANMAGLNVNQIEAFRKVKLYIDLFSAKAHTFDSTIQSRAEDRLLNLISGIYR